MKKGRVVTVFGSGQLEENYPDYQKAVLIGRMIADAGFTICNGGYGGIMEASARGVKEAGGKTIGIVVDELRRKANRWIDDVRHAKTWQNRLFQLMETGDAYVVFDGGTGTLAELFVAWEMTNRKMMQKPIIVYGSFFNSLLRLLKKQHFMVFNDQLKWAKTAQEVLNHLHAAL